ncbi:unnamed protein product, partial [Arabidopsis halleri]
KNLINQTQIIFISFSLSCSSLNPRFSIILQQLLRILGLAEAIPIAQQWLL